MGAARRRRRRREGGWSGARLGFVGGDDEKTGDFCLFVYSFNFFFGFVNAEDLSRARRFDASSKSSLVVSPFRGGCGKSVAVKNCRAGRGNVSAVDVGGRVHRDRRLGAGAGGGGIGLDAWLSFWMVRKGARWLYGVRTCHSISIACNPRMEKYVCKC